MRIVVSCCWGPGDGQGIAAAATELAAGLSRAGHDVYFLAPRSDAAAWYKSSGVKCLTVGPEHGAGPGMYAVARMIEDIRAELVINNDHPYVQAAFPLMSCRKIAVCHAMGWTTNTLAVTNVHAVDLVVALSYDMLEKLRARGVPLEKLVIISNGIEGGGNTCRTASLGHPPGPLQVVFAGNWTGIKGGDLVLQMIKTAPKWSSTVSLQCFGEGRLYKAAKRMASPNVHIHGRVSRTVFRKALEGADVLLMPSRTEGCPMTLIEAMSVGVVPIVSDAEGAMRWMIEAGHDGYVVRRSRWSTDVWQLLCHLGTNRGVLARLKDNARRAFQAKFTIEKTVSRYEEAIGMSGAAGRSVCHAGNVKAIEWHRPNRGARGMDALVQRAHYYTGHLRRVSLKD